MTHQTLEVATFPPPNQQTFFDKPFPLAMRCERDDVTLDDAVEWVAHHRKELIEQSEEIGTLLFRGFPLRSAQDFDAFVAAFDLPNFPYKESMSNAVRTNFTPRVFSANEAPATANIFLHHEMAQTPFYPTKLFFFCLSAADEGGQTPICRSDVLFERLAKERPEFARQCEQKGLCYTHVMPGDNDAQSGMGRSWHSTLNVQTREEAERRLIELGYSWQWLPDECLKVTTPVLPAVRKLASGRQAFFNQLIAAFRGWKDARNDPSEAIRFGDGSALDREDMKVAIELSDELTFDLPWEPGDVALLNNYVVMHGRRSFEGNRKILASLVKE